ncbi:muskelin [Mucor ambiguus]|uniref:Muskelin n=1 Tax=Mucor ambiguus TaxID=91626 RepID=A0A0C9LS38_9FUNG|nr:muskelin [Mucor ambiguus]
METPSSTPTATPLRRSSLEPSSFLNQIRPSLSVPNMKAEYSLQALIENAPHESLPYHIHDHSSFSGPYHPRNICVNDPTEQSSRWSSNSHDQSQYVTIKLEKPAVACEILFGKFHRSHVCNLKEFKIYGGLDPNDMKELLHKGEITEIRIVYMYIFILYDTFIGLTDDNKAETFPIRYTYNNLIFPIQYVKITPLATFGANFNYSIWYIEVRGIKDEALMSKVYDAFNKYKELETIRLCLKHFRQKNMMDVYATLQKSSSIELEDPLVEQLHQSVVVDGDFEAAERMIRDADEKNIFRSYVENARYLPTWQKLFASNDDGDAPCGRGGHQLCVDADREKIYLFGGWDGNRDLSDFWCYHIKDNRWKLLSTDTTLQGGPSPRSCHAMCYDPIRKSIYVLGKYIEVRAPSTSAPEVSPKVYESDFFQYFTDLDRWIKISDNTQIDGGPALLCDHQMCIDVIGRKLYVFGGRIVTPDASPNTYSGFYSYDVDEFSWSALRYDINHISTPHSPATAPSLSPSAHLLQVNEIPIGRRRSSNGSYVPSPNASQTVKSRAGHSMLMDAKHRRIYIFAGQRGKEALTDLYCYNIEQDRLTEVAQDFSKLYGSDAGYTQRATIDIDNQEIYVFSGFLKSKPNNMVRNCLWVYNIKRNEWEKVYESESTEAPYWQTTQIVEPYPRYTHQIVYNTKSKAHFMFGGNPGDASKPHQRLDDFWELKLAKPDSTQVVRQCLFLLRTRKLSELCKQADIQFKFKGQLHQKKISEATMHALDYLRKAITPIVDHDNKEEVDIFKKLCTHLCILEDEATVAACDPYSAKSTEDIYFVDRTAVFQSLLKFFPASMKEPEGSLIDAVKIG